MAPSGAGQVNVSTSHGIEEIVGDLSDPRAQFLSSFKSKCLVEQTPEARMAGRVFSSKTSYGPN